MMSMGLGEVLAWLIYCWTSGFGRAISRDFMINGKCEVGFRRKNVGFDKGEVDY